MATWRRLLAVLLLLALALGGLAARAGAGLGAAAGATCRAQRSATAAIAEFWRAIRQGDPGTVSAPNPAGGVLIQSEGDNWRAVRNGPLSTYGVWGLIGVIALLALFFALRGRIRIEHGRSGETVTRFNFVDRFAHWLTATCFVVLALTGLNMLYGRYVLRPLIGARGVLLADHRRQVRARLPRLRLHARPRADVRPVGRPQLPQPLRSRSGSPRAAACSSAACTRRPRSSTPARRSSSGW